MIAITKKFKSKLLINILLMVSVIILAVIPLFILGDAEFSGADGQAQEVIEEINPSYHPWLEPFWEPPSSEIESLLFALQAAIGAGFIGYYIGYQRGKRKAANNTDAPS